ncbi:hypothetical protein C1T31_10910 [Hanstruepera neustonica]|uniref:Thioredoxin domain-containing protein n=2 Tax=Hanstruepera neustonica TaxID=1445657 RepID=A0A2K1DX85_9FLAO|nr:hypothetical protein C1T31_10910 [Hanstruepera neustonica]
MGFIKRLSLILFMALSFVSCKDDTTASESDYAYLGGEVINPRKNFVILSKSDRVLDTVTLDANNRFLYKIDNLENGLYTFKLPAAEGLEYQMVLLEPRDSIMFRLNTLEFDESLVYTGIGAKKNNYLINLFLDGEAEDKIILGFSQLPAAEFENRLDSIRNHKFKELKKFTVNNTVSPMFNELVEGNINYDYYLSKEVYPFVNYSQSERKNMESLPNGFYDYRKQIDYNYCNLMDYFPYYSFLKHHFENIALAEHFKLSTDSVYNVKSLDYNLIRLKLIDSLVVNDSIRNSLLTQTAIEHISNSQDIDTYDTILQSFLNKNKNQKQRTYVSSIVESLKGLKAGNKLPLVNIIDNTGKETTLRSIINKPAVIYFWSSTYRSHIDSHKKANELKMKYPEVQFVAINVNNDDENLWRKIVKEYRYDPQSEFLFANPKDARHKLAIYPINKVMIVNQKGEIANAHTSMFNIRFEEELLGLLNQ